MQRKKFFKVVKEHKIIAAFFLIGFLVFLVVLYKLLLQKPEYIYARVKVSQGLWWAKTESPNAWLVQGIHKGDTEVDLTGKPLAEIISKTYYPQEGTSQYFIYLTVKLRVHISNQITFNRIAIGVGSPIDFSFPTSQFSGTVMDLKDKPIATHYVSKTVTLTKKGAYPWEYDSIKVGDSYFNGEDTVLGVVDKNSVDTNILAPDLFGNNTGGTIDARKYITIKLKMKLTQSNGQYYFGDEQIIRVGKGFSTATSLYDYNDYFVSNIE